MISIHNIIRKNIVSTTSTKLQLDDTFITDTVFGSLDIKTNEILWTALLTIHNEIPIMTRDIVVNACQLFKLLYFAQSWPVMQPLHVSVIFTPTNSEN